MRSLSVKLGVMFFITGLFIFGNIEVWGADWKYQQFNKWGILFQYPNSFRQLPEAELLRMKRELSGGLDFAIKERLAVCGERFIQDFTMLTTGYKFEVALSVMKVQFKKQPTVDCFLRERKTSLKPEYDVRVFRLEKTKIGGYDAVLEDIEQADQGNRSVGLHILAGRSMYELGWIVSNRSSFKDWEKPLMHVINTIKVR